MPCTIISPQAKPISMDDDFRLPSFNPWLSGVSSPASGWRSWLHARMLTLDEWFCPHLPFPPLYDELQDDNTGWSIRELLENGATGKLLAYYNNGLRVPRSLFFSRFAVMLLATKPSLRRMVSNPYGFSSGREILVKQSSLPD